MEIKFLHSSNLNCKNIKICHKLIIRDQENYSKSCAFMTIIYFFFYKNPLCQEKYLHFDFHIYQDHHDRVILLKNKFPTANTLKNQTNS